MRLKSGQEATDENFEGRSSWSFFGSMMFLKDNFMPRKTCSSILNKNKTTSTQPKPTASSLTPLQHTQTSLAPSPTRPTTVNSSNESYYVQETDVINKTKNHKRKNQDDILKIERKKIKLFEEKLKLKMEFQAQKNDEDYLFFMSLLPQISRLDNLQKMKVKMGILELITKEIEKNDQIQLHRLENCSDDTYIPKSNVDNFHQEIKHRQNDFEFIHYKDEPQCSLYNYSASQNITNMPQDLSSATYTAFTDK